jgi:arylsulfatase A-like enzyme
VKPRPFRGVTSALLAVLAASSACAPPERPLERVVLFTVDTLRADQLGAYGDTSIRTPNFDRLAAEGLLFERAYSQAPITHPAITSMLTGMLPTQHGIVGQAGRIPPGLEPVQSTLQRHGVRTGSFVANLCRLQVHPGTVFHDGWDERFCGMLDDPQDYRDHWEWDRAVVDAALDWMAAVEGPSFVWIHLMDPHDEYRPPPFLWDYEQQPLREPQEQNNYYAAYSARGAHLSPEEHSRLWALYRAQVEGVDMQLGRVLERLAEEADTRPTAIVFSADHGEELFESWAYPGHGSSPTEGVLHIPMVVRAPGLAPDRVRAPVELLQIAPTVLELFDVPVAHGTAAPSLLHPRPSRGIAISHSANVGLTLRSEELRFYQRTVSGEPVDLDSEDLLPEQRMRRQMGARHLTQPWLTQERMLVEYGPEHPHDGARHYGTWNPSALDVAGSEHAADVERFLELLAEMETRWPPVEGAGGEINDPQLFQQLQSLGYAGYGD